MSLPSMKVFWWLAGAMILAKLWMVGGHELLAKHRYYDDSLFLVLAQNLLNGDWLGQLDYRTLIKGPGYPLFIAAVYWAGIPLLAAQQLLYAIACLTVVCALTHLTRSRIILFLLFVILLFNPFTYYYPMVGALMRESIYNSFALLFLGAMLGLWLHHGRSVMTGLLWSVLLGFAFSMLWLTREETVWTVPGAILFTVLFVLPWRWNNSSALMYRFALLAIPLVMAVSSVWGIARINAAHYGAPVFIEVKSDQFVSALGSLMNIREDGFKKGRIVGKKSESAAFRVSPTFASLKPYIEKRSKKRPNVFYIWTLRSAVNDAGYYADRENIQPALDVYVKIGAEITAACEAGEIRCFDRAPTLQPPLYPQHKKAFAGEFLSLLWEVISFREFNAESDQFNSTADMGMLMTFDYVTGESAVRKSVHLEQMRPKFADEMRDRKEGLMAVIGKGYQLVMPIAVVLALISHLFLIPSLFREGAKSRSALFGLVVGGSILGILVILTYVKVTLFDVVRPITVVYPLILLYVTVMLSSVLAASRK